MDLNHIEQNIKSTKYWNDVYISKKNKVTLTPVNFKVMCACGMAGGLTAMLISTLNYGHGSIVLLSGLAGYTIGMCTPKLIKEIRIGDYNYQIMINDLTLKDLEKQKTLIKKRTKHAES